MIMKEKKVLDKKKDTIQEVLMNEGDCVSIEEAISKSLKDIKSGKIRRAA